MVMFRMSDIIWLIWRVPCPAIERHAKSIRFWSCWIRASPENGSWWDLEGIDVWIYIYGAIETTYLLRQVSLGLFQSVLDVDCQQVGHSFFKSMACVQIEKGAFGQSNRRHVFTHSLSQYTTTVAFSLSIFPDLQWLSMPTKSLVEICQAAIGKHLDGKASL